MERSLKVLAAQFVMPAVRLCSAEQRSLHRLRGARIKRERREYLSR